MGRLARQRDTPLTPLLVHDGGGLSNARRCSHDSTKRCVVALRPVAKDKEGHREAPKTGWEVVASRATAPAPSRGQELPPHQCLLICLIRLGV